jgi:hypothetical protein
MPNTNETLFIVIFSLIATVIVLLTYVCWLKRIKMRTKIYEQKQIEQQQIQQSELTPSQLQELKPVLLQKLYGAPPYTQADQFKNNSNNV